VIRIPRAACPAALFLSFALAACSFEPGSFDGTQYRCGSDDSCPSGFSCAAGTCVTGERPDAQERPDAIPGVSSWLVDTADEMTAAAAASSQAGVAARGAIEPYAYYTGALLSWGSDAGKLADAAAATWDDVTALPSTGRRALARGVDIDWRNATPPGYGFTSGDDLTVAFEGELWLDAGTWTFTVSLDDRGFLDIASAAGSFQRVATAVRHDQDGTGTFVAASSGWYPIRCAVTEDGGGAGASIRYRGPGVASSIAIPRHRLRARVDDLIGLAETAFDDQKGKGDHATRIDTGELANIDWRSDGPLDMGLTAYDFFSVRWAGQLRIDVSGSYTFRYLSDDGQRLWIDGAKVLDRWDEVSHNQVTSGIQLDAGWHDIVIDVSEATTTASAELTIESGPDLVGEPLPLARLRPVEGRGERFDSGVAHGTIAIPAPGTVEVPIAIPAPTASVTTAVDLNYTINHQFWGDLTIDLVAPGGGTVRLRNPNTNGSGQGTVHHAFALAGAVPATGTWKLRVNDPDSAGIGSVLDFQITVRYTGGEPPIATSSFFETAVRDLGAPTSFDSIRWGAQTPGGSGVALRLRTCDAPADCASMPWSAPLVGPSGATAPFAPRRYLQWRAELTSDGDAIPSLEFVAIDTR
jgi:subtilisin-like proprotein convertase family protein